MCASNNAIEQQALIIADKIKEESTYKPVKVHLSGNQYMDIEATALTMNLIDIFQGHPSLASDHKNNPSR